MRLLEEREGKDLGSETTEKREGRQALKLNLGKEYPKFRSYFIKNFSEGLNSVSKLYHSSITYRFICW